MPKYPCLVLDHDDTVVQSEATVNYPCFVEFLRIYRPEARITLQEYVTGCSRYAFTDLCRAWYGFTDEEMQLEYQFWKEYARSHIPEAYPGMGALLHRYKAAGGLICVSSMSSEETIRRDYRTHFGLEPDAVFGCDLPPEQRKPSPYALEQIMARWGLTPENLLVVDDMKFACPMARGAGVSMAFAAWGRKEYPQISREMRALCDFSFDSPSELEAFLFEDSQKV